MELVSYMSRGRRGGGRVHMSERISLSRELVFCVFPLSLALDRRKCRSRRAVEEGLAIAYAHAILAKKKKRPLSLSLR